MEKGIQIALRYLENKLTRLINRGVLIKLTQSQNNYSNLHFYCSTLVFNIYFLEFAKLLGGPGPPRPLPTLRHCSISADGVTFPHLPNFVEFGFIFGITAAAGRLILLSNNEEILLSEKFSAISPDMTRKQKKIREHKEITH